MQELDTLIFDIQDVGSRYYTQPWPSVKVTAAQNGRRGFRPTFIGASQVEGGGLTPGQTSALSIPFLNVTA